MLNKIKTNPYAYLIWLILPCGIHICLFRTKINYDYQFGIRILIMLIAICFTLPMHELIHFVFMKMFAKGSVKIKIIKSPLGQPTLATTAQDEFQKWQLIIVYLSPFIFLTLLIDLIIIFGTKVKLIFFVVSVCNCAGCFYDIFDALTAANKK